MSSLMRTRQVCKVIMWSSGETAMAPRHRVRTSVSVALKSRRVRAECSSDCGTCEPRGEPGAALPVAVFSCRAQRGFVQHRLAADEPLASLGLSQLKPDTLRV